MHWWRHGHGDDCEDALRLKGKIAVITGASQGLGLAMAERFTQEGALGFISEPLNMIQKSSPSKNGLLLL